MGTKGQTAWNKGLKGISEDTRLKMRLKKLGKPRAPITKQRNCPVCLEVFVMSNNRQKFCSSCQQEGHAGRFIEYNLPKDQYLKMVEEQKGLCKFCGRPERQFSQGTLRKLSVDHDHLTNKVRGLLCATCNLFVVGKHDIESARHLLHYLKGAI
jgi:hypothetical protein